MIKGLYREDVPEISVEAMREAIINAFCHRDYRDPDFVQIAVFKDRIEIRKPGGLFGGLTIEDILKGNVSKRRNQLVAELLRRVQMVEAWGRGMPLILNKEPSVKFREVASIFIASFERPSFAAETEETTEKTTDKRVTPPEEVILELIAENPNITQKAMAARMGLTEDGIYYHISKLKKKGVLQRVGGKKPDDGR